MSNYFSSIENESCFEPLRLKNGHKEYELDPSAPIGIKVIPVQLPHGRSCHKCVLRWHWKSGNINKHMMFTHACVLLTHRECFLSERNKLTPINAGNNWGRCNDGSQQVGCGPQETYRNCADIAVSNDGGIRGPLVLRANEFDKPWLRL